MAIYYLAPPELLAEASSVPFSMKAKSDTLSDTQGFLSGA